MLITIIINYQSEVVVLCLIRNALCRQTNWALLQIQEVSAKADSNDLGAIVMSWRLTWWTPQEISQSVVLSWIQQSINIWLFKFIYLKAHKQRSAQVTQICVWAKLRLPEGVVESPFLETLTGCLDMLLHNWLLVALLTRELNKMTSSGPFRPQPFCDSVFPEKNLTDPSQISCSNAIW